MLDARCPAPRHGHARRIAGVGEVMEDEDPRALYEGTTAVRVPVDAERLAHWFAGNVPGFTPPLALEQFKGGQSNPTYRLTDGAGRRYVLRRKPPGTVLESAHAVDREYRVIRALGATDVPVPRAHALCTDDGVIGSWFYVMEYVEGRVIWDLFTDRFDAAGRRALWFAAVDALARLHRVDHRALGLADFGREGGYVERQVRRWSSQYAYTREALPNPSLARLIAWLPDNLPEGDDETCIVHGDPQVANMVFAPDAPQVRALLDWELSTLGHPISDLAYFCRVYYADASAGLAGESVLGRVDALGMPHVEETLAHYCARSGRAEVRNWEFYVVFNFFRMAAILQGIAMRVHDGTAASEHARLHAGRAAATADCGWRLVESMRAEGKWR
jgi:aminoglycoside phosphotransferase (APT) family kinase protein